MILCSILWQVTISIRGSAADVNVPRARFSIIHPQAFPGADPRELLSTVHRLIGDYPLAVLEITSIPEAATRHAVRRAMEASSTGCVFLSGLPIMRAGASLCAEGEARERAVTLAASLVREAADLGAEAFVMVSGADPGAAGRGRAIANLLESLAQIHEHVARTGHPMTLRLEPTDREMHWRQLLGPTSDALGVVSAMAARGLVVDLNIDVSHILQLGEDIGGTLGIAASKSRHVHLSNCVIGSGEDPLFGDHHPPFGHPGSETGPSELVRILHALHYHGFLSADDPSVIGIEVVPLAGDDPWATLDQATSDVALAWHSAFAVALQR